MDTFVDDKFLHEVNQTVESQKVVWKQVFKKSELADSCLLIVRGWVGEAQHIR